MVTIVGPVGGPLMLLEMKFSGILMKSKLLPCANQILRSSVSLILERYACFMFHAVVIIRATSLSASVHQPQSGEFLERKLYLINAAFTWVYT